MKQISITLDERDTLALEKLANKNCRDIRQQAATIIRKELYRQGLITFTESVALSPSPLESVSPSIKS